MGVRKTNRKNPARPRTMFKKGHPKYGGRKKGTPNRFTGELKTFVLDALANARAPGQRVAGPREYLEHQAARNSKSFMQLIAKLLPTQVTGEEGKAIQVKLEQAQAGIGNLSAKELATLQQLFTKMGIAITESENPS